MCKPNSCHQDACIELREKLLFSSKTSEEIEYDAHLVQKLFLRTLERGSESDHVLQEVRPVLRHPDTCDEQILSVTQRASVDERKRSKLFSRKAPKVQLFHVIIVLAVLLVPNKMIMNSPQIGTVSYFQSLQVPSLKLKERSGQYFVLI